MKARDYVAELVNRAKEVFEALGIEARWDPIPELYDLPSWMINLRAAMPKVRVRLPEDLLVELLEHSIKTQVGDHEVAIWFYTEDSIRIAIRPSWETDFTHWRIYLDAPKTAELDEFLEVNSGWLEGEFVDIM